MNDFRFSAVHLLVNLPLLTVAILQDVHKSKSRKKGASSAWLWRGIAAFAAAGLLIDALAQRVQWLTVAALLHQLLWSTGLRARLPGNGLVPAVPACTLIAAYFRGDAEMRESAGLAIGRIDGGPLAWATLCVVLSTGALVGWSILWVKGSHGPIDDALGRMLTSANLLPFAAFNAVREEMEFRMLLMGGLLGGPGGPAGAAWTGTVVILQAALFAVLHVAGGFPSGNVGGGLVFIWGTFLGILRVWTGGMGLVMCLHFQADVVIFVLVMHAYRRNKRQTKENQERRGPAVSPPSHMATRAKKQ